MTTKAQEFNTWHRGRPADLLLLNGRNPWLSLWWLVTGKSVDGALPRYEAHRLSRAEALRLYTAGSAWFSFDENSRGTLKPGKLADMAVLSEDFFSVDEDAIPSLESVLTLVGGRPVYANADFRDV